MSKVAYCRVRATVHENRILNLVFGRELLTFGIRCDTHCSISSECYIRILPWNAIKSALKLLAFERQHSAPFLRLLRATSLCCRRITQTLNIASYSVRHKLSRIESPNSLTRLPLKARLDLCRTELNTAPLERFLTPREWQHYSRWMQRRNKAAGQHFLRTFIDEVRSREKYDERNEILASHPPTLHQNAARLVSIDDVRASRCANSQYFIIRCNAAITGNNYINKHDHAEELGTRTWWTFREALHANLECACDNCVNTQTESRTETTRNRVKQAATV